MQVRDVTNAREPGAWKEVVSARHNDAAVMFAKTFEGLRTPMPKRVEVRCSEYSVSSVYEVRRELTAVPVDPNA